MKNYAGTLENNSISLWLNTTDIGKSTTQCEKLGTTNKIAGAVVNIALSLFGSLGNVLVIGYWLIGRRFG